MEIKENIVDSRSMKYMLEKYMLIGVAQLTKRESDRGKETFPCPSESTRAYTQSTED